MPTTFSGDYVRGTPQAVTISPASLASDANLLAGREGTAVNLSATQAMDWLISSKITSGTTPTVNKSIEHWVAAPLDATPTWLAGLAGTDANVSVTSRSVWKAYAKLVCRWDVSATSNVAYVCAGISMASLFGPSGLPKHVSFWIVHDTAVNLNSTAGNHVLNITPIYPTMTG
jgi:hypothetical protein